MTEEAGSETSGNPGETTAPSGETSVTDTTTTDTTTTTTTEGDGGSAGAPSLVADFADADLRGYAEGKGFDKAGFEGVVKSYNHLEKIMSADKAGRTVIMLGDDPTPEAENEFYTKLGRPEDAKGYGLTPAEGSDPTFAEWAGGVFHKAGLTNKQADAVASAWAEYTTQVTTDINAEAELSKADAVTALKKEWGAAYDNKVAGINVAATKLGLSAEALTGLHKVLGSVEAMKFVDGLNTKIGDHVFEDGETHLMGLKTPEQAKTEMNELLGNKEFNEAWLDRLHPGHKAAIAKKAALSQQMAGQVPA